MEEEGRETAREKSSGYKPRSSHRNFKEKITNEGVKAISRSGRDIKY